MAADTRTFIDGVGMSSWLDRLGGFVQRHLPSARWAGVAAGALVLLLWPAPTLTVLIWVVALIALYLGLLEWLQSRAADPVSAPGQADAVPPASGAPANGAAAVFRAPAAPPARPATRETCRPWAAGSTCSCGWVKPNGRRAHRRRVHSTEDPPAGPTGTASVTSPVHSRHPVSARRCPGRRQAVRLRLRVRRAPRPTGSPTRRTWMDRRSDVGSARSARPVAASPLTSGDTNSQVALTAG